MTLDFVITGNQFVKEIFDTVAKKAKILSFSNVEVSHNTKIIKRIN